jgi:imidazolonepropionase-like amidohydrolase
VTGGHCAQDSDAIIIEADGPYAFRAAVREQIKTGADWIKILASHRTHMCEVTQEELNAVVDETHRWHRKCCIHAGTEAAIEAAIEAGFNTIEHGTFMTIEQAQKAKAKGIAWIPTLIPYMTGYEKMKKMLESKEIPFTQRLGIEENYAYYKESVERYTEYFKRIADTGIKIAVGTDMDSDTASITLVADEMDFMVKLGMDILEVIKCGTSVAAEILGLGNKLGLLEEGYIADIVVVNGNGTEDITALKNVKDVYRDGEVVYSK